MNEPIDPATNYIPACFCIRVVLQNGKTLVLPCVVLDEDQTVGSHGTNPLDRMQVEVAGEVAWVERRDLCEETGELIEWRPVNRPGHNCQGRGFPMFDELCPGCESDGEDEGLEWAAAGERA